MPLCVVIAVERAMPRLACIDFPGALHHVMARGIERRASLRDDARA